MNKKLSKIKSHTMIFDHQICKHVSKKFATIIRDEFLYVGVNCGEGGWPCWETNGWLYFLEEYISDHYAENEKIHQEYIDLKNYLDGTEIKYIVVGD